MGNRKRRPVASIGVRLSQQAKDSNLSLEGYIRDCRALADRLGADVLEPIHVDDGVSGSIRERPELLAWLDDAVSGRADILIAPHTDRITRDGVWTAARVLDVVEGVAEGQTRPVRLVTVDGLDSDNKGSFRLSFVIQAELARAELERITARNANTRRRLAEQGRWSGAPVPFTMQVVTRQVAGPHGRTVAAKFLEPHPVRLRVGLDVAARYAGGEAMRALTRWMNTKGYTTNRGGPFRPQNVRRMLRIMVEQDQIEDRALRHAVKARLAAVKEGAPKPSGGRPTKYLATGGVAVCAECGRHMTTSDGRYICQARPAGLKCDSRPVISPRLLDPWIEERFLDAIGDDERTRTVAPTNATDNELDEVAAEIATTAAAFATATPDEIAVLAARLTDLRTRERELESAPRPVDDFAVIQGTGETWREAWEAAGDAENRRALLLEVGFRVLVGRALHRGSRDVAARCRVVWL